MTELLPPDPLMWRTNTTLSSLLYTYVCGGGSGGQKDEETFDSVHLANMSKISNTYERFNTYYKVRSVKLDARHRLWHTNLESVLDSDLPKIKTLQVESCE